MEATRSERSVQNGEGKKANFLVAIPGGESWPRTVAHDFQFLLFPARSLRFAPSPSPPHSQDSCDSNFNYSPAVVSRSAASGTLELRAAFLGFVLFRRSPLPFPAVT